MLWYRCLKKYCDCFNSNIRCKKSCRCIGCKNGKELDCDDDEDLAQASETTKKGNDQSILPLDIMLPDKISIDVRSFDFQTDTHSIESLANKQKETSRVEAVWHYLNWFMTTITYICKDFKWSQWSWYTYTISSTFLHVYISIYCDRYIHTDLHNQLINCCCQH